MMQQLEKYNTKARNNKTEKKIKKKNPKIGISRQLRRQANENPNKCTYQKNTNQKKAKTEKKNPPKYMPR